MDENTTDLPYTIKEMEITISTLARFQSLAVTHIKHEPNFQFTISSYCMCTEFHAVYILSIISCLNHFYFTILFSFPQFTDTEKLLAGHRKQLDLVTTGII